MYRLRGRGGVSHLRVTRKPGLKVQLDVMCVKLTWGEFAEKRALFPIAIGLAQETQSDDHTIRAVKLVLSVQTSLIRLGKLYRKNRLKQHRLPLAMSLASWTILSSLYIVMCSIAVAECTARDYVFGFNNKAL